MQRQWLGHKNDIYAVIQGFRMLQSSVSDGHSCDTDPDLAHNDYANPGSAKNGELLLTK